MDPRGVAREYHALLETAKLPSVAHGRDPVAGSGRRPANHNGDPGTLPNQLTMNTYSQVLPALQADAAAKLDTVLSKG